MFGFITTKMLKIVGSMVTVIIIIALAFTILCIKRSLTLNRNKSGTTDKTRQRPAVPQVETHNISELDVCNETTFATGTPASLNLNYMDSVPDPRGNADLEAGVHIPVPADVFDSYDDVRLSENTMGAVSECSGPHERVERQGLGNESGNTEPCYLEMLAIASK